MSFPTVIQKRALTYTCPHCKEEYAPGIPGQIVCGKQQCDDQQMLKVNLQNERAASRLLRTRLRLVIEFLELLESGRLKEDEIRTQARELASKLRPDARKGGQ